MVLMVATANSSAMNGDQCRAGLPERLEAANRTGLRALCSPLGIGEQEPRLIHPASESGNRGTRQPLCENSRSKSGHRVAEVRSTHSRDYRAQVRIAIMTQFVRQPIRI